jgi:hypothetical protein
MYMTAIVKYQGVLLSKIFILGIIHIVHFIWSLNTPGLLHRKSESVGISRETCPAQGHDEVTLYIAGRATYCLHVTLLSAVVMETLQLLNVTVLEIRLRFIVLRTLHSESGSCDFRIV